MGWDYPAADQAAGFWDNCLAAGWPSPALGARDTLRPEAGMNLYGSEMDETIHPWRRICLDMHWEPSERDFIGRKALEAHARLAISPKTGWALVMKERAVLRGHQKVIVRGCREVRIDSGSFFPLRTRFLHWHLPAGPRANRCTAIEIRGKTCLMGGVGQSPRFLCVTSQARIRISFSFFCEDSPHEHIPADLRYAASHEWTARKARRHHYRPVLPTTLRIAGDVVFVELPDVGPHRYCR